MDDYEASTKRFSEGNTLRILQATPYYPPHWGGLEIIVNKVTCGLRSRGHKVEVVTTYDAKSQLQFGGDTDLYRVPINFKLYNTPVSMKAYGLIRKKSHEVDLIHAYGYPVFFTDLSAHFASTKVPFILEWVIDPRETMGYRTNKMAKFATDAYMHLYGNRVFKKASAVITLSQQHTNYLTSLGVSSDKIEVIPCGVDTKVFNPNLNPIRPEGDYEHLLLFVGRINNQKGIDLLLQALPEILKEYPKTLLLIIGLCDQAAYWRKLQPYLRKMKSNIRIISSVPPELLAQYYRAADLLIFPSRYESFGMVPLEAAACGTPVLSTMGGAVAEATKKVAYVIKDEDPSIIANSVNFLLSDHKLRKKMTRNGVELIAEKYSWEAALNKYETLYKKCS